MSKALDNKKRCLEYFELFSNKDLQGLEDIFSDEVTLSDWELCEKGKFNVLRANKSIFKSVASISVDVMCLCGSDNTIFAELEVVINNVNKLLVVDVISFDNAGRIKSIKAYKQ